MAVTVPLPTDEQAHRIAINKAAKATVSTQAFRQNKSFLVVLMEVDASEGPDYSALLAHIQSYATVYSAFDQIDGVTPDEVAPGNLTNIVTSLHIREDPIPEETP